MLDETIGIYEQLRSAELDALEATQRWADAEVLALPAKEYYQERRLRSLNLLDRDGNSTYDPFEDTMA